MTLYNEIDPYAAQWLRNLSIAGHIAPGTVDERSIRDVRSDDVVGATQFHTFAGIGVWSYALRLAGWPDDKPVWTGSCPCQPFSTAGKGGCFDDPRHLWPAWFSLIRECRPPVVFGEQVSSLDGRTWLDSVCSDLEGSGYAVGALVANSSGVGAPHIRQRIYFGAVRVADAECGSAKRHGYEVGATTGGSAGGEEERKRVWDDSRYVCDTDGLANPNNPRPQGWNALRERGDQRATRSGGVVDPWTDVEWLPCRDGKYRPTQPGLSPLATGATSRVGRLRAYGNCITAQVAATFVTAFMDATSTPKGTP